jgi:low affinity Fe/Cu permease
MPGASGRSECVVRDWRAGIRASTASMRLLRRVAIATPPFLGSPYAFLAAIVVVIAWVIWGVIGGFTNDWLLWPSAIASVFTFLIVFSLQYTQNRDTRSIQLKLDEVLRTSEGARNDLVKLETLSDQQLSDIEAEILRLRRGER